MIAQNFWGSPTDNGVWTIVLVDIKASTIPTSNGTGALLLIELKSDEAATPNLTNEVPRMKSNSKPRIAIVALAVAVAGEIWSAEDKYSLRVPKGLAISNLRENENS